MPRVMYVASVMLSCWASAAMSDVGVSWQSDYVSTTAGRQDAACRAYVDHDTYSFSITISRNDIDFSFEHVDFGLPANSVLGEISAIMTDSRLTATASSASTQASTTSLLYLHFDESSLGQFLNGLVRGSTFSLTFPSGFESSMSLANSQTAMRNAVQCWRLNPTGDMPFNPFATTSESFPGGIRLGEVNPDT